MITRNSTYAILTGAFACMLTVTTTAYSMDEQNTTSTLPDLVYDLANDLVYDLAYEPARPEHEQVQPDYRLIEQTGITTLIYSLADMVGESSRTHAARCGSKPVSDSITGFNADSVIFDLVSDFRQNHKHSIEPVQQWYQSALAKKIQKAEKQETDYTLLTDFLDSEHYKNPHRKTLISHIIDNVQAPRFVAILGTEVEYAGIVHSGCIQTKKVTGKVSREQRLADITREDKKLTALLLRGNIIQETAYMYRELSDEELMRYNTFTSSEAGSYFYSRLIDATEASFKLAGDRLTSSLDPDLHGSIDF